MDNIPKPEPLSEYAKERRNQRRLERLASKQVNSAFVDYVTETVKPFTLIKGGLSE